jgi:hypothetical protein
MLGDGTLIEVPLTLLTNTVEIGAAHPYARVGIPRTLRWGESWDLAPDGRIIANELSSQDEASYITLRLNWEAALKK